MASASNQTQSGSVHGIRERYAIVKGIIESTELNQTQHYVTEPTIQYPALLGRSQSSTAVAFVGNIYPVNTVHAFTLHAWIEVPVLTLDSRMPVVAPQLQKSRSREQMKAAILDLVKENPGIQYLEISLALHLRLRITAELVKELVQAGNLRSDPVTEISDGEY